MRYGCAVLFMLMSSVATASAQGVTRPELATPAQVERGLFGGLVSGPALEPQVSVDEVIARMMQFDRNGDFKLAIDELPERMQTLVVRGDRSDDLMLDVKEIRRLTGFPTPMPVLFEPPQFGYRFGDTFGTLSTRTHIDNTIDDLRLRPQAAEEAKRIGSRFADELERESDAKLDDARRAALASRLSGILTDEECDNFRAALARRPLVKAGDVLALVQQLRQVESVRKIGFTVAPTAP